MMIPGDILQHKLTSQRFIFLGKGGKDDQQLGTKIVVRNVDHREEIFYEFEFIEVYKKEEGK